MRAHALRPAERRKLNKMPVNIPTTLATAGSAIMEPNKMLPQIAPSGAKPAPPKNAMAT